MRLDACLKFDPPAQGMAIKGETTDSARAGAIEILSFEQEMQQRIDPSAVHVVESRSTALGPLRIIKSLDQASIAIYDAVSKNTVFPKAVLSLCQPKADGAGKIVYLEITCEKVQLDRVHLIGDPRLHTWYQGTFLPVSAADIAAMGPLESFELHFQKIEWLYKGAGGIGNFSTQWMRRAGMA